MWYIYSSRDYNPYVYIYITGGGAAPCGYIDLLDDILQLDIGWYDITEILAILSGKLR